MRGIQNTPMIIMKTFHRIPIILLAFIICTTFANLKNSSKNETEYRSSGKRLCISHANCLRFEKCLNASSGDRICGCKPGRSGEQCEIIDECVKGEYEDCKGSNGRCVYNDEKEAAECDCGFEKKWDAFLRLCRVPCKHSDDCQHGHHCFREGNFRFCHCEDGFAGDHCQTVLDCELNAEFCGNKSDVTCYFSTLYGRTMCECDDPNKVFDDKIKECGYLCSKFACKNDGECELVEGAMKCKCKLPYAGDTCETMCICENGRCVADKNGKMKCDCNPNHSLTDDETCKPCDCGSQGKCIFQMKTLNGSIQYQKMCICDKGTAEKDGECVDCQCGPNSTCEFEGENKLCYCEEGYSEKQGVCTRECECTNGFCEFDGEGNKICTCPPGYGLYKESDWCVECNCGKGAKCIFKKEWFGKSKKCICPEGYSADSFGTKCIGDCSGSPCKNGGTCEVVGMDIECLCQPEYVGDRCENKPCVTNSCENNGVCELEDGKVICTCNDTFIGDRCETNACDPNPCRNEGSCTVKEGKVICWCKSPFYGRRCDEADQCDLRPCKNGGKCSIVKGKVKCTCRDPYTGVKCDEKLCDPNPCRNDGKCDVMEGKENCKCQYPYTGDKCDKIDHCASSPCQNGGSCRNGNYTFECTCTGNYGGKDCSENAWCVKYGKYLCGKEKCQYNETIGRGYCVCRNGKIFYNPSETCTENECSAYYCYNGGVCKDKGDGPKCYCKFPFSGERCEDENECSAYHCHNGGVCKDKGDGPTCYCKFPFSGERCIYALDPCFPNPCKNNGTCVNEDGKYKCICEYVYIGKECEIDYRYIIVAVLMLLLLAAICVCCGCYLFRNPKTFPLRDSDSSKTLPGMS